MTESIACFLVELDQETHRFRRVDTGEVLTRKELPPGAMWQADWMGDDYRVNGGGPVIVVILPNGNEWMPGSRSANCPHRAHNGGEWVEHDCWCVHGEMPNIHVDKTPEPGRSTCTAGAGSISSGQGDHNWHGFLHHGHLVTL